MNRTDGLQAAATVAITLLLAFVAYSVTAPRLHSTTVASLPSPTPSPPAPTGKPIVTPASPQPTPTPGRFSVVGFDVVDASHAWLLASDCPLHDSPTCRYEVARSQDGGATWSRPGGVGPVVAGAETGSTRTIRFVNARDGFVYNESVASVTHDGGITWRSLDVPFVFVGPLAIGGGKVWLVTYPCPKGTVCARQLRTSADGGRTWSEPRPLPADFGAERIDAFAGGAMLAELTPPFGLELTADGGTTWRDANAPCPASTFRGAAASPDAVEVWAACYPNDQGTLGHALTVWVSENGGRSWVSRKLESVASSVFVSPRPRVLFASLSGNATWVTRDGGLSWNQVPLAGGPADFVAMRFVSADFGWATDGMGFVSTTTDGGLSWATGHSLPGTIL